MGDQIQLSLIIEAQVDRVLSGMTSFEKGLKQVQGSIEAASAAAQQHQTKFESFTASVERSAKLFASIWVLWESAKDAFSWIGDLEKFNIDIANMTNLLQGNATAASTWMQVATLMGLDVNQVERAFVALSKQMDAVNSPALRQMGLSAEDANGHLKSLNEMLLEAADYFHAHEGASNNAALAQQLFGRSGADLLPILEQGRAGLDAVTQMAQKYGLVLSAEAIQKNLQFTEQLKETEMAMRGLGITLSNAVLPGIDAMGIGVSMLISQNLPELQAGLERTMGYLLGFVEGLTGLSLTVDGNSKQMANMMMAMGDFGTQASSAASGAQALADAEQRVRDQAEMATTAIDAQIHALQSTEEFQKFTDAQTALKQKATDEQAAYDLAKFLNNNVQAQQLALQLAATQLQISRGQTDEDTKLKISALEAQKKSIQDAANDQIKEMQRAARGGADAFGAMSDQTKSKILKDTQSWVDAFQQIATSGAFKTGEEMSSKLLDALFGPAIITYSGKGGNIEKVVRNGADWMKLGEVIGEAIGIGIGIGFGKELSKIPVLGGLGTIVSQAAAGLQASFDPNVKGSIPGTFGFDEGGTVPGPPGSAHLAIVHGAEVVRTPQQEAALQAQLSAFASSGSPAAFAMLSAGGSTSGAIDLSRLVQVLERLVQGQDRHADLTARSLTAQQTAAQLLQSIDDENKGTVSGGQLASWSTGR